MNFIEAIISVIFQYAVFSGRACRSEYWYWVLFVLLANFATVILDAAIFPGNELSPINAIFCLTAFVPGLAVTARRLHDIDRSGWWQLLGLVPIIGWIVLLVWAALKGDERSNRFGDNPLASEPDRQAALFRHSYYR